MHGPAEQRSDEKVLPADADAIYDSMRSTVALASSSSSIRRSVLGEDEEGWWLLALARTGHGEGRASCGDEARDREYLWDRPVGGGAARSFNSAARSFFPARYDHGTGRMLTAVAEASLPFVTRRRIGSVAPLPSSSHDGSSRGCCATYAS